jgi:hypothetical protein
MLIGYIIEEKLVNLFKQEKGIETYFDGKAIADDIETDVYELDIERVDEQEFFFNGEKYLVYFELEVTHSENGTDIKFIDCHF